MIKSSKTKLFESKLVEWNLHFQKNQIRNEIYIKYVYIFYTWVSRCTREKDTGILEAVTDNGAGGGWIPAWYWVCIGEELEVTVVTVDPEGWDCDWLVDGATAGLNEILW